MTYADFARAREASMQFTGEVRDCACGCGQEVRLRRCTPHKKYASEKCARRVERRLYADKGRVSVRGRTCPCGARDDEVSWPRGATMYCEPCARAISRNGRCKKCRLPKRSGSSYVRPRCANCDPPPRGSIKVILLDKDRGRERAVYRSPISYVSIGEKRVRVTVAADSEPIVTLPTKKWLNLRA